MPLASITFNFMNGWVEPPPVEQLPVPVCVTIGNRNRNGVLRDRNRRATVTKPKC